MTKEGESSPAHAFAADHDGLLRAVELLVASESAASGSHSQVPEAATTEVLPTTMPEVGVGAQRALDQLATPVLDCSRSLRAPGFFAHMDPPTPWITWAMHLWTASRNQNLLHPDTAPIARALEERVIAWMAPAFGMTGGHLTPGSTIANLTAIWAAREAGADTVVATTNAHLSIAKAAHILGMNFRLIDDWEQSANFDGCVAVITAGSTSTGEIERLDAASGAHWRHVDAAWSGPLVLSDRHRPLLRGIDGADSISVSAHKWLFQPKESAMVLFNDVDAAHRSVSFGADYLAVPNVGVLGSHGAVAVPLLATLLAYGRQGIADWIDASMALTDRLAELVDEHPLLDARTSPQSGVLNWRRVDMETSDVKRQLPEGVFVSTTVIGGEPWLRSVAANPLADPDQVVAAITSI